MNIRKIAAACLAAGIVAALPAEESRPTAGVDELSAANKDAVLDTIAQINHINWVVNVIKSYNNVIVLEEEYEKISPGNLYLDRIPDEETLGRITKMLDTLYSLRKDDRQMKGFRWDPDKRPTGMIDITPRHDHRAGEGMLFSLGLGDESAREHSQCRRDCVQHGTLLRRTLQRLRQLRL